jgi:mRNA interferase RelE/StbE
VTEPWRLAYARRAERDLRRLDKVVYQRVIEALERLVDDPASADLRRLRGSAEWRMRVGDWRVRLELDWKERTIVVVRVLPRGRAYER